MAVLLYFCRKQRIPIPRDAEKDAELLVVAAEAAAIAPDPVLVIVVCPSHHEVVAADRAALVRFPINGNTADHFALGIGSTGRDAELAADG